MVNQRRISKLAIHSCHAPDHLLRKDVGSFRDVASVDVSYAIPQAHGIVNVALHREYSPCIVIIFSQGRKDLYHV
jgi:hypothetical protein